jgi:hypothetical protein
MKLKTLGLVRQYLTSNSFTDNPFSRKRLERRPPRTRIDKLTAAWTPPIVSCRQQNLVRCSFNPLTLTQDGSPVSTTLSAM